MKSAKLLTIDSERSLTCGGRSESFKKDGLSVIDSEQISDTVLRCWISEKIIFDRTVSNTSLCH
jgi:hypothetical protein